MPAKSIAQRQAMAIAEHHPEKLHKANRGMLSMSHAQFHDFASTREAKLPERKEHGKNREKYKKSRTKGHGSSGRDGS